MIHKPEESGWGKAAETHRVSADALRLEVAKAQEKYLKMLATYTDLHGKHAHNAAWNKPLNNMYQQLIRLDTQRKKTQEFADEVATNEAQEKEDERQRKLAALGVEGSSPTIKINPDAFKPLADSEEPTQNERAFGEVIAGSTWRDPKHLYGLAERARTAFESTGSSAPLSSDEVAAKLLGRAKPGLRGSIHLPGNDRRAA